MKKTNTIVVQETNISVTKVNNEDYICLTDMVKANRESGRTEILIQSWMRRKDTILFLAAWESLYNPVFNYIEFDVIKNRAGVNSFILTPKEWNIKTNAIGVVAKTGRYGGTYAHKDIAYHFGMWLSPAFNLLVIKEFQRLKDIESNPLLSEWGIKRVLSKVNYTIHTDAIKDFVIPKIDVEQQKLYVYADEADLLNLALWGCTAKQWREVNVNHAQKGLNIRDVASINELVVLSNMESFNAELLKRCIDKSKRYTCLWEMAQSQLARLNAVNAEKGFRAIETAPEVKAIN
ncbi:hypothetical protein FACS1894199_17120 [Bacteroidia bacterium]|nr:hypothetical protein FACS1894199_17120 [Bacteroidia bacterium]